jgi:5-methylcytosine-specific restriction protein A
MTKRRRISAKDRIALFQRECGLCHLCNGHIQAGEAWDISHEIPLELGGADDETNMKPAHRKCHRSHTAMVDAPMIAKAKRTEAKHLGATRPKGSIAQRAKPEKTKRDQLAMPPRRPMFVEDVR